MGFRRAEIHRPYRHEYIEIRVALEDSASSDGSRIESYYLDDTELRRWLQGMRVVGPQVDRILDVVWNNFPIGIDFSTGKWGVMRT